MSHHNIGFIKNTNSKKKAQGQKQQQRRDKQKSWVRTDKRQQAY